MTLIQILIVDDEAPARNKLRQFLNNLNIDKKISEAGSTEEAMPLLSQADLVFLDIQMPGKNAFQFIETVGVEYFPPIIFTTAYHEYAIKAFEVHALDYLLKPYTFDRFKLAFDRAIQGTGHKTATAKMLEDLLDKLPIRNPPQQLWVKQGEKLIPLQLADISHFESDGNYVQVFSNQKKYLLRDSLKALHEKLGGEQFVQVHRSTIINRRHLVEMFPRGHGDLVGVMKGGQKVVISRRYRGSLLEG